MKILLSIFMLFMLKFAMGELEGLTFSAMDQKEATINCDGEKLNFDTKNIDALTLNCTVPNTTYSELLSKLKFTSVKTLTINIELPKFNLTLNSTLFQQLNLSKLIINCKYSNISGKVSFVHIHSDFLYILNEVEDIWIHGVAIFEDRSTKSENIGTTQCARLQTLKITACDLREVPHGWLRLCKKLLYLHISQLRQRNGTKETRRKVLAGAKSLRKLEILNCFIEELEDELVDLKNLEILNVAHNQIHYALTTIVLPNLVVLDLSHNHIFSSALFSSGAERQPKLRVLSLDYNTVLDICDNLGYRTTVIEKDDAVATWHNPLNERSLNLNSIERFSLRGTITKEMCFGHLNMDSLEYFDLSDSKISAINFRALPLSKSRRLEVNVSGCPIVDIPGFSFNENVYKQLRYEELRITGLNVTLHCDCDEYLWLAKAARERKLILSGAICASGQDLATVSDDNLRCNKYSCGACVCRRYWQNNSYPCDECICRRYWKDNATDVECSGELHSIPKEPGLRRLYASGNLVENVTASDIPDTLIYLDLSKNHIARMTEEASKALFKNPKRKVKFFGNPIICDCENEPFILELMDHFDRVEDYAQLTCIDEDRLIRDVNPTELCFGTSRMFLTIIIASLGAFVGIVALVFGLYYRFGKAAKVYLYSKGLCLFCIREEEIDADREYDAFVSFSHKDEQFVIHDLVAVLESEPCKYKLCVHYRNWIAGELIPAQINHSIANSKRTIIVLSKSFLDSIWGLLEFRTAHLSALKEGRTRLVIIIVDDILETGNLDGELRSYLRNNTYVKWGDPWFWDKLKYALPHRSLDSVEIEADSNKIQPENLKSNEIDISKRGDILENEEELRDAVASAFSSKKGVKNTETKDIIEKLDAEDCMDSGQGTSKEATAEINKVELDKKATMEAADLNDISLNRQASVDSAIEMENFK